MSNLMQNSHYTWLDNNLESFFKQLGLIKGEHEGISAAHGDKCYSYRQKWENAGIHFFHGVAIYLAGHCYPYSKEVRNTENGWVDPCDWVICNYNRFVSKLEPIVEYKASEDTELLKIIANILQSSLTPINFDATQLTKTEKRIVKSQDNLDKIKTWIKENQ